MNKSYYYNELMKSPAGKIVDLGLSSVPGISFSWGLIKGQFDDIKNVKSIRILEFFEHLGENKSDFYVLLDGSQSAIDGLLLCVDKVSSERNSKKRKLISGIFLGYLELSEEEKEKYELERLLDINSKITVDELEYLTILQMANEKIEIDKARDIKDKNYYIKRPVTAYATFLKNIISFTDEKESEVKNSLSSLGILYPVFSVIDTSDILDPTPDYDYSSIGKKYIEYISKEN